MRYLPIVKMVSGSKAHPHSIKTEIIAYAKIDAKYAKHLRQFRWTLNGPAGGSSRGYPIRADNSKSKPAQMLLHREVASLAGWDITQRLDHKDNDKLNAQLSNLRYANASQNGANAKRHKHNTTGFKGVHRYRSDKITGKKYTASIMHNGKDNYLGTFNTPEKAAIAYDREAVILFGEFAMTNKLLGLLE